MTFLFFLLKDLRVSKILKTPIILVFKNAYGLSIDLSTCVSAARLKIPSGLNFLIIFKSLVLLFISNL